MNRFPLPNVPTLEPGHDRRKGRTPLILLRADQVRSGYPMLEDDGTITHHPYEVLLKIGDRYVAKAPALPPANGARS